MLGVEVPHTVTTVKPSGTVSKLFGLTEGWHLPSMRRFLRWVQYRNDDPLVETYKGLGYPVRELQTYKGHTIVGFPTEPTITTLEGIEDHIVTAAEASMEDQFEWLRLGEAFWLEGHDATSYQVGIKALPEYGNQLSYTMKYKSEETGFDTFRRILEEQQATVRCCSVMPQDDDGSVYEYLPSNIDSDVAIAHLHALILKLELEATEYDAATYRPYRPNFRRMDCRRAVSEKLSGTREMALPLLVWHGTRGSRKQPSTRQNSLLRPSCKNFGWPLEGLYQRI